MTITAVADHYPELLGQLLHNLEAPPPWARDALCLEHRHLDFTEATTGPERAQALDVCDRCLVSAECLTAALADPTSAGIRGGTTEEGRKRIRRDAKRPPPK